MGVSPYRSIKQLWEEKVFGIRQKETFAMTYGRNNEGRARDEFEKLTGLIVFPRVVVHEELEWISASLDGLDIEEKYIVEIKCPGKIDHHFASVNKMVPKKYIHQIQHQLFVTGLDFAYYYSFYGDEGMIIEIDRDEESIEMMIEKEKQFWDCVQNFTPLYTDCVG
jgi:putative phage-type endonuclease